MFRRLLSNHIARDFLWSGVFLVSMYGITHNPIVRPMPKPTPGAWSIQYMQHPLLFGFAGHNYLTLRNGDGDIVSELHGLATDPQTKRWQYIGWRATDLLQVWEFDSSRYYAAEKKFPGIILTEGTMDAVYKIWQKASPCKEEINMQRIPYPPYGFSIRNETTNSNSVAYTLADCMGLPTKHIGIFTPGEAKNLLAR